MNIQAAPETFNPQVVWSRVCAYTKQWRMMLKGRIRPDGTLGVDVPLDLSQWRVVSLRRISETLGHFVFEPIAPAPALVDSGTPEVHVDSDHSFHRDMYQTLDLLKIQSTDGPIYFIVEGCAAWKRGEALDKRFFYEEHTCPTNFIRIPAVFTPTSDDPHGVFEYVRSVWMPRAYGADDMKRADLLRDLFPETRPLN